MKKKTLIVAVSLVCLLFAGCDDTITEDSSISTSESVAVNESAVESAVVQSSQSHTADESSTSSDESFDSDEKANFTVPVGYSYEFFKDDLFIGDSIFTGLSLYDILDERNVTASVGSTIHGVHYNTLDNYNGTAVDYAEEMQPPHINIMLGTNMLGMLGSNVLDSVVSFTSMVDDYKSLINALETACPNSQICVISVPPVTADNIANDSGVTKDIVDTANKHIEKMCTEMNIKYFDLNTLLSDKEGYLKEEYAETDGIHFKINAYDVLLYGLEQMWK